jgi:effector-binding domain-containing protein
MKKVVRLTESDLTRIVKKVIRENEEERAIEDVAKFVFDKLSKEDIISIGNLYNKLGHNKFEDTVEDVVSDDLVNEDVTISKSGFEGENSEDVEKIENIKNKVDKYLGFNMSSENLLDSFTKVMRKAGLANIGAILAQSALDPNSVNQMSNTELELRLLTIPVVVMLGVLASKAIQRIPINLRYNFDEKLRGGKLQTAIDFELNKFDKKETFDKVINYFEKIGISKNKLLPFIYDWEKRNNFMFNRDNEEIGRLKSKINYYQKK